MLPEEMKNCQSPDSFKKVLENGNQTVCIGYANPTPKILVFMIDFILVFLSIDSKKWWGYFQVAEAYSEPCQTFKMERFVKTGIFRENNYKL